MPIQIKNNPQITQQKLMELLSYDSTTGAFTWKPRCWVKGQGDIAGTTCTGGYRNIKLLGRTYKAHRLAWLYVYGQWPVGEIDHINRVRADNRLANLREVSRAENMSELSLYKNNLTGVRGVFHDKGRDRYRARVTRDGKQRYLGSYRTARDAEARYLAEIRS